MPSPLPRELLSSGRELTEPRLAPTGPRQVAFVQRAGSYTSVNAVWLDGDRAERTLTFGPPPAPGRGLAGGCFTWVARDEELSLVYVARDGALWWQRATALVRLDGPAEPRGDGLDEQREARVCRAPMCDESGRVLVYAVDEASIWLIDLAAVAEGTPPADARRRVDDGRHEFCFDPCLDRAASTVSWQAWSPPDMAWDRAARVDVDLATGRIELHEFRDAAIQQPRFRSDGRAIQIDDRSGWLNLAGSDDVLVAEPVEHAGPTWGMGARSYAVTAEDDRIAVTRNEDGFGSVAIVDPVDGSERSLGRGVHGHLDWVGSTLVALRTGARTPTQVVAYDVSTGDRDVVARSAVDAWPLGDLPEPQLVEATADDGAVLHGRRYAAGNGRLLAWVHGGPTDQWRVDWRPRIHYWWSRGWDVLVVDPRGTTGHGRVYQQALHGRWGRLDVDDTAALVRAAHVRGWSSPSATVVIGGSSGGLTVLGLLADHGALVAGGVASYPVSDLRALAEATHRFEAHYTDTLVAPDDGSTESARRFRDLSPLWRSERISAPLLLFHGTDDPVVPIGQSRRLVERLLAARPDADVELVEYEGEGHGFRDPVHVADEYGRTEDFLRRVVRSGRG